MNQLKIILSLILLSGAFMAGYYFRGPDETRIISSTETISKPVIRNYSAIPVNELTDRLKAYDTGVFKIDGTLHDNIFRVDASLSERTASREFTLSVGQRGGWKMYLAVGAVGACAGGYLLYKIIK
jgi:hypothetical protein